MNNDFNTEACVTSLAEALLAEKNGADRIEICQRLETEGMTPDYYEVSELCDQLSIPVRVMIRHTETGFEADQAVLDKMLYSISKMKHLEIEGFVFGVLKNNEIDRRFMIKLLNAANPFPVTFHKAIDLSQHLESDIQWINDHSLIDTILTSGGAMTAAEGVDQILRMKKLFDGEIMAGGKIMASNLEELHEKLGLNWYHGRKIVHKQ